MDSFDSFSEKVNKARAEAVQDSIELLMSMPERWQARAWWLERCEYQDWGQRQRLEHTGKDGQPLPSFTWPWMMNGNTTETQTGSPGNRIHTESETHSDRGFARGTDRGSEESITLPGSGVRQTVGENGSKRSHSE